MRPSAGSSIGLSSGGDEDEQQADHEGVDADGLRQRDAEDVGHEDRARRLGIAPQGFHGLADGDAQADAGADGPEAHGESGGEIGFHLSDSSYVTPAGSRRRWIMP